MVQSSYFCFLALGIKIFNEPSLFNSKENGKNLHNVGRESNIEQPCPCFRNLQSPSFLFN